MRSLPTPADPDEAAVPPKRPVPAARIPRAHLLRRAADSSDRPRPLDRAPSLRPILPGPPRVVPGLDRDVRASGNHESLVGQARPPTAPVGENRLLALIALIRAGPGDGRDRGAGRGLRRRRR